MSPEELLRLAATAPEDARSAALAALTEGTGPEDQIGILRAAAVAAKELGHLEEGLEHLAHASRLAEATGSDYVVAQVRMNLVGLLAARGDLSGALETAAAAAEVLQGADADRLAANRACALARAGRLDEALTAVREALPRLRQGGDPPTLAGLLTNLGLTRALRGELAPAEDALTEAAATAERAQLHHQAAMAKGNLAFVVARRGDVPRALRLFAAAEPGLTGERVAQCRFDQAETLIAAGLAGEARPLLASTLAGVTARGYGCDVADGLLLLAHAELADGDAERAAITAERARAAFAGQERTGWMLLAEHLLLRARWAAGDRSPVFYRSAVATADRLGRGGWPESEADARIIAARLALHLGRPAGPLLEQVERAHGQGPATLRVAAWHATALERWTRGDRRGTAAAIWAGLQVADEHAEVFGALELRAHAAGLGGELADLGLRLARSARELLAAEERRRAVARRPVSVRPPQDPERAIALAELRTASAEHAAATARGEDPRLLAERIIRLEATIRTSTRRHSPTPPGRAGAPPHHSEPPPSTKAPSSVISRRLGEAPTAAAAGWGGPQVSGALGGLAGRRPHLSEFVSALGERALVELVRVGDELNAVTVAGGRCRRWSLGSYDEASRDVSLVRFALQRLIRRGEEDEAVRTTLVHAARRAGARVPAALREALGGRELVIAPTGALHGLPWAALPLLAGHPFTIVPSAASWLHAEHRRELPERETVLLVGGPGLEHAEAEVSALSRLYPRATVLRGSTARAKDVRQALDGAGLAHLAAHGEFRDDNALFSRLRLADGPLMAYDLQELDAAPRTVVLSACDAGRAGAGDGVMGLVGVLLGLGTATVVASVVPVQDSSTHAFMAGFHENLARGLSPAHALAAARRSPGVLGFLCFGAG